MSTKTRDDRVRGFIAVELRRMADEDDAKAVEWLARRQRTTAGSEADREADKQAYRYERVVTRLRDRANELDGGGQ